MSEEDDLQSKIKHAVSCISKAISDFGPDRCALSFNGGKDCTVLLDLLTQEYDGPKPSSGYWSTCYVAHENPFPELEQYPIRLHRIVGDMKSVFSQFLGENPQISCIFVGVRLTDPYCAKLSYFSPTDNGWPSFMRVHPILDWSYANVWQYLIGRSVPYCSLYDRGYTSLGGPSDTLPNPFLRMETKTGDTDYIPAYRLVDELAERAGRIPFGRSTNS